jgi:hypothetical protein
MWKVMQAIVLFATAGVLFASQFFEQTGLPRNPLLIVAIGLGITTMLMYRSLVSLLAMVAFGLLIRLPDVTLAAYHLDRQVLLAAAIALLCLPWIQRFMS